MSDGIEMSLLFDVEKKFQLNFQFDKKEKKRICFFFHRGTKKNQRRK